MPVSPASDFRLRALGLRCRVEDGAKTLNPADALNTKSETRSGRAPLYLGFRV